MATSPSLFNQIFYFLKDVTEMWPIYNVVFISAIQQSVSHTSPHINIYIYIYIYIYICYIYIIFRILSHYGLWQDTEYSFLCYTVGPCCQIFYLLNTPLLLLHPFMTSFPVPSSLLTCTSHLHVVSVPCNYIFNPCSWWLYVLPP